MTAAMGLLRHIASLPPEPKTAREIIARRLGRDLGPVRDMPPDLRTAMYRLALQLQRHGGRNANR